MADNTVLNAGTGGDTIATDDILGVKHQMVKVEFGALDTATLVTASVGLPTDPLDRAVRDMGKIDIASLDQYVPIDVDSGAGVLNALPITWRKTSALGVEFGTATDPVRTDPTGTTAQPVSQATYASLKGNVKLRNPGDTADMGDATTPVRVDPTGTTAQPVTDNAGSFTVDAPVATPVAVRVSDGAAFIDVRGGDVAHNAADSGNPVKIGAKASGVLPTAVASLNRTDAYFDREGRIITRPYGAGSWSQVNFPAVNTRSSSTKAAAAAGIRHVCTGFTASLAAGSTAPAAVQLDVRVRDGILDTGTILWQMVISLPATAGAMNGVTRSGLHLTGTAATAMTIEFSAAGGANTFESVSIEGYDITEA